MYAVAFPVEPPEAVVQCSAVPMDDVFRALGVNSVGTRCRQVRMNVSFDVKIKMHKNLVFM